MKVLVVHNMYRGDVPSGENIVVQEELDHLASRVDVDVDAFLTYSDEIDGKHPGQVLDAALGSVWSPLAVRRFRRAVVALSPDVIHVHNVYPLISPQILYVASTLGVPLVHTVHNYRHGCVAGTHFRAGSPCTLCLDHPTGWPGIRHTCYRDSLTQSAGMVLGQHVQKSRWEGVARFLCVSHHQASLVAASGIPSERIRVKANSVPDPGEPPLHGPDIAFVGRLDETKGLRLLLDAWRLVGSFIPGKLRIIGDGPMREKVDRAASADPNILVVGAVPPGQVMRHLDGASILVVPSIWPEPFGRTAVEGMSASRVVVATAMGALPELLDGSYAELCQPRADRLAASLVAAAASDVRTRGSVARQVYLDRFRPDRVMDDLVGHYREVIKTGPRR